MQKNNLVILATFLCLFFCIPAYADTASEIGRISEEIALLQAKLSKLEMETKIAQKESEFSKYSAGSSSIDNSTPAVRGIEGVNGKLKATFAFGGGMTQTAGQGDVLANGWKVISINASSVTLAKGKNLKNLAFGNEPPPQPQTSSPVPGLPMPRMP